MSVKRHVTALEPLRRLLHSSPSACKSSSNSIKGKYGTYPVLPSSSAITAYPDPLPVPTNIARPPYVPVNFFTAPWGEHDPVDIEHLHTDVQEQIELGTGEEEAVRRVAKMAGEILQEIRQLMKPGITTAELDRAIHERIVSRGAYPSPLGYSNFPKSCTTSVNNVIAHGIPDDRPLHPQDIINVDLTLYDGGYHGDTSYTFTLPDVDRDGRQLVEATREALDLGIRACGPGKKYNEIGRVIEDFARRHGFSVNSQFTGHGIGRRFHQPPWIVHTRNTEMGEMRPGDCFTIEPSLVQGSNPRGDLWDDGWTMATETGARSAQFEHQVLITHDGVDILTKSEMHP